MDIAVADYPKSFVRQLKTMKLRVIPALLSGLFLTGNHAVAETFYELDGFVYFEAEAGEVVGNWVSSTTLDHFSGDSYIVWDGPDLFSTAGQDIISYQFNISTPGNYELRWRTRIAKGDSNTEANDSWVRFPTGVNVDGEQPIFGWSKVFMGHHGAWFWDAKVVDHVGANVRQFFDAGTHTMEISGRSNGHAIDKMVLFKYEDLELSPNDLDTRSGTPQASVDGNAAIQGDSESSGATVIASGLQYTPGECVNGTLALPALADLHVLNGGLFNQSALQFAPQPAVSLLRFDIGAVGAVNTASLEMTIESGQGDAPIEFALLDDNAWQETDSALDPAPEYVLQLALAERNWTAGTRYSVDLPAEQIASGIVNMSIAATMPSAQLTMASRENSLQMPLLVLKGNGNFCENYQSAVSAMNVESTELPTEPEPTETESQQANAGAEINGDGLTEPTQTTVSQGTASGGSSGGGALGLFSVLLLIASRASRRRP